jgi:hypothetical protein
MDRRRDRGPATAAQESGKSTEPERIKARASPNRSATARRERKLPVVTAFMAWKSIVRRAATIAGSAQTT